MTKRINRNSKRSFYSGGKFKNAKNKMRIFGMDGCYITRYGTEANPEKYTITNSITGEEKNVKKNSWLTVMDLRSLF